MGEHLHGHRIHANSVGTLLAIAAGDRDTLVLGAFDELGGATDREICEACGYYPDMNKVRPAITHLVEAGSLVEVARVVDPKTRKPVRVCERSAS